MQSASQAYRDSIEHSMYRNNGYIKVSLGVVNQLAQESAAVDSSGLYYFSDGKVFSGEQVTQMYATPEQNFSKVDGTMYFAPIQGTSSTYYNQGAVSSGLVGSLIIRFGSVTDLDIKGFTIDFSESYPTRFTIETDAGTKTYDNDSQYFSTEDTFDGTSYIKITPLAMVNGQGRLRILNFTCGIANTFTNNEVINYSSKEYVSPICDSLPSMDMSITIDNQDQYYNPDNPESALSYMEVGQEVTVQFGYDVDGTGENIEWLPAQIAHLKTWSATDTDVKFTAVDKFDYLLNSNYIKGQIYTYGITLYNLALAVLNDAGITDESEYFIDEYLKKIVVYNPLPIAKHSECLQIIANAGRCCLYIDREDRIHIAGNFIPDATATTSTGETAYSHVGAIVNGEEKEGYANASQNFSIVNGTLHFLPSDNSYLATGFISQQVSASDGTFSINPVVTISLETEFVYYGLGIYFRNTAPRNFTLTYYNNGSQVDQKTVTGNTGLVWTSNEQSVSFNELRIEFTKGYPNSRVFIDNIKFGDSTDYTITRDYQLTASPTATRHNRVQAIAVSRQTYSNSTETIKSLKSETITVPLGSYTYKEIEFSNASYGYRLTVNTYSGSSSISYGISTSGAHYARIYFYPSGGTVGASVTVQYTINGYEYVVSDSETTNSYHASGDIVTWNNPLVSDTAMAQDIADWLGDYYNGDVTYQIPWRGDPRVDANDLFWLELKKDNMSLVRAYQNELSFNGGWSGTLQARNYKNTYKEKPPVILANGVLITFSDTSITESASYDYVIIYYQPDENVQSYKRTANIGGAVSAMGGKQIFVPAFKFWVYWRSDGSVTRDGWAIVSAVGTNQDEAPDFTYTATSLPTDAQISNIIGTAIKPSALNYINNEHKMWYWDLSSLKNAR